MVGQSIDYVLKTDGTCGSANSYTPIPDKSTDSCCPIVRANGTGLNGYNGYNGYGNNDENGRPIPEIPKLIVSPNQDKQSQDKQREMYIRNLNFYRKNTLQAIVLLRLTKCIRDSYKTAEEFGNFLKNSGGNFYIQRGENGNDFKLMKTLEIISSESKGDYYKVELTNNEDFLGKGSLTPNDVFSLYINSNMSVNFRKKQDLLWAFLEKQLHFDYEKSADDILRYFSNYGCCKMCSKKAFDNVKKNEDEKIKKEQGCAGSNVSSNEFLQSIEKSHLNLSKHNKRNSEDLVQLVKGSGLDKQEEANVIRQIHDNGLEYCIQHKRDLIDFLNTFC